jgi:hypothetical protein
LAKQHHRVYTAAAVYRAFDGAANFGLNAERVSHAKYNARLVLSTRANGDDLKTHRGKYACDSQARFR